MNCQQFENLMSDYLDDTLSLPLRRQCAEHLIECPSCHSLFNDVRAVVHICCQVGPVEPLTDLSARILQATAIGAMMSCLVFDELILDYFDGFITASEFHIFEAHFDMCPRCQRLMNSIQLARELCQHVKSVEMPEGLHERILDVTTGAARRARQHRQQGILQRVIPGFVSGVRTMVQPLLSPEFVTALLLCLASLGLLLVDFSDDMSLRGVYRQARLQVQGVLGKRDGVSSGKEKMASDLQEVKARLSRVIETGIALFSETPNANPRAPSHPPSDGKQLDNRSLESSREPTESDTKEEPRSQKPETW